MSYTIYFYHYGTIALAVALNSISVGIGEGLASLAGMKAMNIQPKAQDTIFRTMSLGMALIETSAVIGLTIALLLLQPIQTGASAAVYYAEIGIALAICLSGAVIGIAASFPVQQACYSIARQPFFDRKIQMLMLLTQSLMQTPIIFAFIVALLIKIQAASITDITESFRLIASGLCIGVGSIGPSIGLALFSQEVCKTVGFNREAYNKLFQFTLFSEALIESPLIFALLVSLIILQMSVNPSNPASGIIFIAAALAMGLGTFGPAISSGKISSRACREIALFPHNYDIVAKTSLFGQVLLETGSIYTLIVAFTLLLQ